MFKQIKKKPKDILIIDKMFTTTAKKLQTKWPKQMLLVSTSTCNFRTVGTDE